MEQGNQWALPGGFIKKNEPIENAAYRVLQERTGVQNIFLQQFNVFGAPDRSDASIHQNRFLEYVPMCLCVCLTVERGACLWAVGLSRPAAISNSDM